MKTTKVQSDDLPHSVEAEQQIIGNILVKNELADEVAATLKPDHFYDEVNGSFYQLIIDMVAAGTPVTPVTLWGKYQHKSEVEGQLPISTQKYLIRMYQTAISGFAIKSYAEQVIDLHHRRRLIADMDTARAGLISGKPTADITSSLDGTLNSVEGDGKPPHVSIVRATERTLQRISDLRSTGAPGGVKIARQRLAERLGSFYNQDLIILAGRPSMGKEQPVDMPVLTPNGWREIGSLNPGDMVIGKNGNPTRVNGVFPQGIKQAYQVTFGDGCWVECGIDHIWSVAPQGGRYRGKFRDLTLREIIDNGVLRNGSGRSHSKWRIPIVEPICNIPQELPIHPYLIGVLIGDGCTVGRNLRFSTPDIDRDIRDRCETVLPEGIYLRENRSGACPYFELSGSGRKNVREDLGKLMLCVKSAEKRIPEIYIRGSVDQRMELLRGLMDTDGGNLNGVTLFYTTSEGLSRDVAELVRSLGGVASINSYDRRSSGRSVEYTVRVNTKFCPFYTNRKISSWKPRRIVRCIRSVEKTRIVEQVCISVDADDGLYVTKDHIVTHNTAMATSLTIGAAQAGHPVAFVSAEMSEEALTHRLLAELSGVPYFLLRKPGSLDQEDLNRIGDAAMRLADLPIEIICEKKEMGQIASACRSVKRKYDGIGMVVADYMQIILDEGRTQTERISNVSKNMKQMAKDLDCPVMCLSQLSRQVETREDKRPQLSDLRDSGQIEQDADVVMFCYREHYYLSREVPQKADERVDWDLECAAVRNQMDVITAKQRMGPIGSDKIGCDITTNRFWDLGETNDDDNERYDF